MGVASKNFDVRVARILWKLVIHFPRIAPERTIYRDTRDLSRALAALKSLQLGSRVCVSH